MGITGGGVPLLRGPSAADVHVGAPLQCVTWGGGNGVPQPIFEILSFLEGLFLYIKF